MPHTVGSKSQATNHTPHLGSQRHQQHTSNKSYTYHASHRASNTQATNASSYYASHRFQKITSNRSCLTQTLAFIGNKSFHTDNLSLALHDNISASQLLKGRLFLLLAAFESTLEHLVPRVGSALHPKREYWSSRLVEPGAVVDST